jgi:predicted Zn-ribbon and HTH transcriptional regulator
VDLPCNAISSLLMGVKIRLIGSEEQIAKDREVREQKLLEWRRRDAERQAEQERKRIKKEEDIVKAKANGRPIACPKCGFDFAWDFDTETCKHCKR